MTEAWYELQRRSGSEIGPVARLGQAYPSATSISSRARGDRSRDRFLRHREACEALPTMAIGRGAEALQAVKRIIKWYFETVYGVVEGPGVLPFYCDVARVGHFAVPPKDLAAGREAALFRLFVMMAMYQARRDVLVMALQRSLPETAVDGLSGRSTLLRAVQSSSCPCFSDARRFDRECSVRKQGGVALCDHLPTSECHVKSATLWMRRTGDMGKLPTSALLHHWRGRGISGEFEKACSTDEDPTRRARVLVDSLSRVYRVGRKLATMYVSALSVPSLAPGVTPWYPEIDGSQLVVIDTNVAHVARVLQPRMPGRRSETESWIRDLATRIDLREFYRGLPRTSARLVQQSMYHFRSRSNRISRGDQCAQQANRCVLCVDDVCPMATRRSDGRNVRQKSA